MRIGKIKTPFILLINSFKNLPEGTQLVILTLAGFTFCKRALLRSYLYEIPYDAEQVKDFLSKEGAKRASLVKKTHNLNVKT